MRASNPGCDARVAVVSLVIINISLLTVGTELVEVVGAAIVIAALLAVGRPVLAVVVLVLEAALVFGVHGVVPVLVVFALTFTYRFFLVGLLSWVLLGGITTGSLLAAMRWGRVPRVLAVPAVVAVRFLPVVVDDARTIRDNLVLRGIVSSGAALFLHPVTAIRRAVLPLVASSVHTGDELSASALLRGLGCTRTPTSVVSLRLGWVDALLLIVAVAVGVLAVQQSL
ncbi:energy-coupling factor transporter transmembrane protein EcfT [Corynebacterium sp. zg-331]|uniref:energy-coupling factor transporter transmembrane component T family protein n=1 Tax=unclassified Corynebacterium TaxID=2624378 RepID=UPI001401992D|nr:energy-coupling factor transporter transmembrane protein EcfT [Corynebacterium sp. zg-331]MPV52892.1 energy-coupling factor transporter transmembrane protein EcfT [Corynebacterium sp. zg331]